MIKSVLTFILVFHIAIPNMASDCLESVSLLEVGTPAPCTGFLFSPRAEKRASIDHIDAKYYRLINHKLTDRHDLMVKHSEVLDKRLKLYMDQSHTLAIELHKQEQRSEWAKVGWFVLGIGVTSLAVYGASTLR